MANDISARQWKLDTPAATVIANWNIKVKQFEFFDFNGNADLVKITDQNGKIVWDGHGSADGAPVRSGTVGWVNGLIMPVLTSGKLMVYTE
jgi:hypothetical protein